jgi:hypothetical protein
MAPKFIKADEIREAKGYAFTEVITLHCFHFNSPILFYSLFIFQVHTTVEKELGRRFN